MMNMLLKYIPFPGKEALYSPLHTPSSTPSPRGKNSYWSRSGGGAHLSLYLSKSSLLLLQR